MDMDRIFRPAIALGTRDRQKSKFTCFCSRLIRIFAMEKIIEYKLKFWKNEMITLEQLKTTFERKDALGRYL